MTEPRDDYGYPGPPETLTAILLVDGRPTCCVVGIRESGEAVLLTERRGADRLSYTSAFMSGYCIARPDVPVYNVPQDQLVGPKRISATLNRDLQAFAAQHSCAIQHAVLPEHLAQCLAPFLADEWRY